MGWFKKSNTTWNLASATPPWQGEVSIYDHIRKHIAGDGELAPNGARLPDERDDGQLKFVAGGMDGVLGGGSDTTRAKMIYRALQVVLEDPAPLKLQKLYEQLLQQGALEFIDPLIEQIVNNQSLDAERLAELAAWIAQHSPDREPVKFAIALLGIARSSKHDDLLFTLGRHEEFTLYATVAFSNIGGDGVEDKIFDLARHVHGWGRIQAVHRLAETRSPRIKAWMLREGYKNSIMNEYLAYTCAITGDLRQELEKDSIDPALLAGAGDIIHALFMGGPAEDMDDYLDGAAVVERYLHHLGSEPKNLWQLVEVDAIQVFLKDDSKTKDRAERGWTPNMRDKLFWKVRTIKELPHWEALIRSGLESTDRVVFHQANMAADALGIDTWDHHFARIESGKDDGWYFVMQTKDATRIDRVVALAERILPLKEIASGPAEELGFGLAWANHSHLGFVLQDLRRFPGKGWPLIRAGLRSPVVRNRHMTLRALSPWGKNNWPAEAQGLLETALQEEPDESVRAEIETLLAGKEIAKPDGSRSDD